MHQATCLLHPAILAIRWALFFCTQNNAIHTLHPFDDKTLEIILLVGLYAYKVINIFVTDFTPWSRLCAAAGQPINIIAFNIYSPLTYRARSPKCICRLYTGLDLITCEINSNPLLTC